MSSKSESQIIGEASLEIILEEIFGTPFADLGWSLLENILEEIFGTPFADLG